MYEPSTPNHELFEGNQRLVWNANWQSWVLEGDLIRGEFLATVDFLGQLFPPREILENSERLSHPGFLLPLNTAILSGPDLFCPNAPKLAPPTNDLISQFISLIQRWNILHRDTGLVFLPGAKPSFLYATGERMWLFPHGHFGNESNPSVVSETVRILARQFHELMENFVYPSVQDQTELETQRPKPELAFLSESDQPGFEGLLRNVYRICLQNQIEIPVEQRIDPPGCERCGRPIQKFSKECPVCEKEFKSIQDFYRINKKWVMHSTWGLRRFSVLSKEQIPDPPGLEKQNRRLARLGGQRVAQFLSNKRAFFWIFSTPDEISPECLQAIQINTVAPLSQLKPEILSKGITFYWDVKVKNPVYHFWWRQAPFTNNQWETLENEAEDYEKISQTNSVFIPLMEPTTIYAAVIVEVGPNRSEAFLADPVRFEPVPEQTPDTVEDREGVESQPTWSQEIKEEEMPLGPPLEFQVEKTLERGDNRRRRCQVEYQWATHDLLEVPLEASMELGKLLIQLQGTQPFPFPEVQARSSSAECLQVILPASHSWGQILPDWIAQSYEKDDFFCRLPQVVSSLLEKLDAVYQAGFCYGVMYPERIRVRQTGEQVETRLDWPLGPLPLGHSAQNVRAPLGYVVPEFGQSDAPAQGHWDLFNLGVAVLWSFCSQEPPAALSSEDFPCVPPRIIVPDLPAGWGGFFNKLLAKRPEERFASPKQARDSFQYLLEDTPARTGEFRLAAALHLGKAKKEHNPKNQDRFLLASVGGAEIPVHTEGFPEEDPQESYSTSTQVVSADGAVLVAIADGISTVSSGEFAAQETIASLNAATRSAEAISDDWENALEELFETANRGLGQAISKKAQAGTIEFLDPDKAPSCTLVAALIGRNRGQVGCVGDSRAYLFRGGCLDQLTLDGDQLTATLRAGDDWESSFQAEDHKQLISWVGAYELAAGSKQIDPLQASPITNSGYWSVGFSPRSGDV
ncbi:MAG: hypothetical protein KDA84_04295, partial [Planctomycetaceae bacterium]|nr:hypothetical protein [Planctomycetaceae bacterium]